jgi:hypothetical protein
VVSTNITTLCHNSDDNNLNTIHAKWALYISWRLCVTLNRVFDWKLGLLTTLTHDSWLHLIIVPLLISTLYKSLQHVLSLFSLLYLHQ